MNSDSPASPPSHTPLSLRKRIAICAILVLAGVAALAVIFNTEPVAQRETAVRESAMLVSVTRGETGTFRPVIEAMGTVRPAQEITLSPRVGGEVSGLSAGFVPGGFVRKGEVLVRIDDADYRAVLQQRESELQQAVADLEIEQGRQALAERDYRELQRDLPPDKKALVLREPHLRAAEARILSAQAAVEQARLDLQRTEVRAPFDAQVLSRDVNVGSQVASGDALARLAGVDTYWVETTLPLDRLRWLSFGEGEDSGGSAVDIHHRGAWPADVERQGHLFRLIGELEGGTRLARALVAVEDPLALEAANVSVPALIIGAFVECRILGREITDTLRISRAHIRSNDTVWLMRDDVLAIQAVDIAFQDAQFAYVRGGLEATDLVVTSSLATVQEGVRLRLKESADAPDGLATASEMTAR